VGRIYRLGPREEWFWGLLGVEIGTPRGHPASLNEAKASFKAAYLGWRASRGTRGDPR
jgi:hypothetical protein